MAYFASLNWRAVPPGGNADSDSRSWSLFDAHDVEVWPVSRYGAGVNGLWRFWRAMAGDIIQCSLAADYLFDVATQGEQYLSAPPYNVVEALPMAFLNETIAICTASDPQLPVGWCQWMKTLATGRRFAEVEALSVNWVVRVVDKLVERDILRERGHLLDRIPQATSHGRSRRI
ncbi:hypothetical protein [Luteibacter sp. 621]|uniref:hypothetical protein n=1 Tax=Luteibacter sp. 621 TaxID=3373916 RepID=UPI003D19F8B8